MRTFLLIVLAVVVLFLVSSAAYTVDRTEFVYVTQFGEHVATHDGQTAGGLHWKWPWPVQSIQRLDRRLQTFDLPETEVLTRAPSARQAEKGGEAERNSIDRTLTVTAYVCWRIADGDKVDWFVRRVGTLDRAQTILDDQIRSQLPAIIGQNQMDDLVSVDPARVERSMSEIRQRLLEGARERAGNDYGIEVVDIRLRRTSHPAQVQESILDRIKSDRYQKAARFRSEGEAQATRIRSEADYQVSKLTSEANAEKKELEKGAETERLRLLNEAYSKDPDFARIVQKIARLQQALADNKSVLYLSAAHEFWELLRPPSGSTGGTNAGSGKKTGNQ